MLLFESTSYSKTMYNITIHCDKIQLRTVFFFNFYHRNLSKLYFICIVRKNVKVMYNLEAFYFLQIHILNTKYHN